MDARGEIETASFADDGRVPNSALPVLIYRDAVTPDAHDPPAAFERRFADNGWTNGWRDGIYPFHHFHSTSHEVLGIAQGRARVRLGGEKGRDFNLEAGDVVVLPAGTGHKRLSEARGLVVVGAYPDGRDWDLIKAEDSDAATHAAALRRIAAVPLPRRDPVDGETGPLIRLWRGGG
jgi:uncharacterized protein YjlB